MIAAAPEAVKQRHRERTLGAAWTARAELAVLGVLAAVALVVRASGLGARSFWLDEALVVHAARVPLGALVRDLDTSPIGFALLARLLLAVPIPAETALRLPAVVGGVGTVVLVYALARRLGLGAFAALGAAGLCAVNATLAYYGREAKPYALDSLAAVAAPLLCERVLRAPDSRRAWVAYAVLAPLPWLLHPSVFVLLVCDAVLAVTLIARWARGAPSRLDTVLRPMALVAALQAASVALLYALVLRAQMTGRLDQYWGGSFLPETRSARVALAWIGEHTWQLYVLYFEDLAGPVLALTALGLGALAWRRRWRALAYVLGPWLLVLAASARHLYPYGGERVDLFLIPGAILAVAAVLDVPRSISRRAGLVVSTAVLAALALPALSASLDRFVLRTQHAEEVGPLVARMAPLLQPGDAVYVYYAAQPAFEWYGRDLPAAAIPGGNHRADVTAYGPEVDAALASHPRTWLLFSHLWDGEREWILAHAAASATEAARFDDVGASVHLFVPRA